MKYKRIFLTITIFIIATFFYLQAQDLDSLKRAFPSENAAYLDISQDVDISIISDYLRVSETRYEKRILLNQEGVLRYAHDYVHFSPLEIISEMSAETDAAYKNKRKIFRVKEFETQSYLPSGFLFRDDQYKLVVFPMAAEGSVTKLNYTTLIRDPRFVSPFFFTQEIPVLKTRFTVTMDEGIEVGWNIFGSDSIRLRMTDQKINGRRVISWSAELLTAFHDEKEGPSDQEIRSHIILYIKSAEFRKETKTYLGDVADLYEWYSELLKKTNLKDQQPLREFTEKLTKNLDTEEEKTKAVFQWVQKNIKYIALLEGLGGFIPEDCTDVFRNRYGDCKGMANLSHEMLKSLGIPSSITWVGTRNIPYSYTENPTLATDNHMILTYFRNGKPQILDPTNDFGSFNRAPYYLQGKQALIGLTDSTFEVYDIPVVPASENMSAVQMELSLLDNALIGNVRVLLTGYAKNIFENGFSRVDTQEEDFINDKFTSGNNKALISNIQHEGLYDRNDTLSIVYSLEMKDYVKNLGEKYYINPHLNKYFANTAIDLEKRKYDYIFDFLKTEKSIIKINIPKGFMVSYLPENIEFSNDLLDYKIDYKIQEGLLIMENQTTLKTLRIAKNDFATWNEAIKKLNKAYQEVIIISKD